MQITRKLVPLVSFPKSGNTWVRFILANLFVKDDVPVTFGNVNTFMPTAISDISKEMDERLVDDAPFLIKEHYDYGEMRDYPFDKAIYIVRDGFDATYSYWHFINAQMPGFFPDIHEFMKHYNRDWGHWGKHVQSWLNANSNVLIIRYEDLLSNPEGEVNSILKFLNIEVSATKVRKAILSSDKSEMKKMKGSQSFMKSNRDDFHFVRSGVAGEGHAYLDGVSKSIFLSLLENMEMMKKFNYLKKEDVDKADLGFNLRVLDNLKYFLFTVRYRVGRILLRMHGNKCG